MARSRPSWGAPLRALCTCVRAREPPSARQASSSGRQRNQHMEQESGRPPASQWTRQPADQRQAREYPTCEDAADSPRCGQEDMLLDRELLACESSQAADAGRLASGCESTSDASPEVGACADPLSGALSGAARTAMPPRPRAHMCADSAA